MLCFPFNYHPHLILAGLISINVLVFSNSPKRFFILKKGFKLVKTLPNDTKEDWRPLVHNQKIEIPDYVDFRFNNKNGEDNLTIKKRGKVKTECFEIAPGESAQIVENEAGKTGLLQKHTNGVQSLYPIGESVNFEKKTNPRSESVVRKPEDNATLDSSENWKNLTHSLDGNVKLVPPANSTITYITDKDENSYDLCNDHMRETKTAHTGKDSDWYPYLVGGLTTTVMMTGVVYIIKNINACARYISRKDIWSSWRSEKPWGLLLQLKPSMIAEEIIHDIHSVYYQKQNPIDLFFKDIEEETDIIMQWIQFRNIVTGLFLPVPPELQELEYRLELLNIMRSAVHYWQAQQWQAKNNS